MPVVTESWRELTHFAKWLTIGTLEITYPKGDYAGLPVDLRASGWNQIRHLPV
jgi:hypothetical protein